ncbi:SDR family NAD(P)-dependent oxidoreductase [Novosphingobium sp. 11B]
MVKTTIRTLDHNAILAGKRILVTGGSLGIGFAIARRYIASGASVVITGRNEVDLRKAIDSVGSDRLHWLRWDVADVTASDKNLSEVETILGGPIDILVNNAGILIGESFPNVSESGWDRVYAVNSKGLFFLTQSVAKRWLRTPINDRVRKIINISSTSGFTPGAYPYRMTKWDVVGMTKGLALNLAPHNIVVNGLAPGRTAGRMLGIGNDNVFDAEIPVGRAGLPEEIAELALFLASDTSNYITGQTIICDGGMTLIQKE